MDETEVWKGGASSTELRSNSECTRDDQMAANDGELRSVMEDGAYNHYLDNRATGPAAPKSTMMMLLVRCSEDRGIDCRRSQNQSRAGRSTRNESQETAASVKGKQRGSRIYSPHRRGSCSGIEMTTVFLSVRLKSKCGC